MSDHNFEKHIQQKLDELKIPPADTVWTSIEAQIRKDKRRRRGVIFFPILFLLIGAGFYFIFQNKFSSANNSGSKTALTNSTLSDNKKSNTSEKSTTEPESATQKKLQDNVSNSTRKPGVENEKEEKGNKTNISEDQPDQKTAGNNTVIDNTLAAVTKPGSAKSRYRKSAGIKNNINVDKIRTQSDSTADQRLIDRNIIAKKQAVTLDTKQTEENQSKDKEQKEEISGDKETVPVPDSQADKTAANTANNRTADSTGSSDLTAVKRADSISSKTIVEEKKTATGKIKQSNWKWGINASAGISSMSDGGFFKGSFFNSLIGEEKALVADLSPSTINNAPSNAGPPPAVYKPSAIEKGFSFSAGAFILKNLSKRFSISTGLQYSYYSTHIKVGNRIDSSAMVQNAFGSRNVTQFYSSAPVPTTRDYTNRFHFVELPVSIHAQLIKRNRLPLFWNAGLSLSYLVSTNALHFDSRTGVYYKDNNLFNKVQANLSTGFSISVWNGSGTPVHIGPQLQYGLTNFMKHEVDASKHLFYFGLNTKIFIKK